MLVSTIPCDKFISAGVGCVSHADTSNCALAKFPPPQKKKTGISERSRHSKRGEAINNFKSTGCLASKTSPLYTNFLMFEVFALKNLVNLQDLDKKNAPLQAVGRLKKPTFYTYASETTGIRRKIEHLTSVPYKFNSTELSSKSKRFS